MKASSAVRASSARAEHFSRNWLVWVSLRHFLSAQLQWELLSVIVADVSRKEFTIDDLFVRTVARGEDFLGAWIAMPKNVGSSSAAELQRIVKLFAWQADRELPQIAAPDSDENPKSFQLLEKMWSLGRADFSVPEDFLKSRRVDEQPSAAAFFDALYIGLEKSKEIEDVDFLKSINGALLTLEYPLYCVAIKHIGDLCVDAGLWEKSYRCYEAALVGLDRERSNIWKEFSDTLGAATTQSLASAMRMTKGPLASVNFLRASFSKGRSNRKILLNANGRLDELTFAGAVSMQEGFGAKDLRPAILQSPLLYDAVNLESAYESSVDGKYTEACEEFWRVLRRQTALGLFNQAQNTRARYACHILNHLSRHVEKTYDFDDFSQAIRLLIESGRYKFVDHIEWSDRFISQYVSQSVVDFAAKSGSQFPLSKSGRTKVVIQLFSSWLSARKLTPESATAMMKYFSELAETGISSHYESDDLAVHVYETLLKTVRRRPELKVSIAAEILVAIKRRISEKEVWTIKQNSLLLAAEFAEVFSRDQLDSLLIAVLDMLDAISPAAGHWPIVRPALQLLVCSAVKKHVEDNREVAGKILDQIFRFGTEQGTENTNFLFYLNDFDSSLLSDKSVIERAAPVAKKIVAQLSRLSSSSTEGNITALLMAPAISQSEGIQAALGALASVLGTSADANASIALPYSYQPLLVISNRFDQIVKEINIDESTFLDWLNSIARAIEDLWKSAHRNPLVFAPFSIPRRAKPDRVVIYNWAISSLRFSQVIEKRGRQSGIRYGLQRAADNNELTDAVLQAMSDFSSSEGELMEIEHFVFQTPDAFYRTVGKCVAYGRGLSTLDANKFFNSMIDRSLEFGPNILDALVFSSALNVGIRRERSREQSELYDRRLESESDVRRVVQPLFSQLFVDPDAPI